MTSTMKVVVAVLLIVAAAADVSTVTVRYNATHGSFSTTEGEEFGPIAATVFTNFSFYENGWDVMTATGNDTFMQMSEVNRLVGYKAAGYGEGYLNYLRIWQNFENSFNGPNGVYVMLLQSPQIVPWINRHYEYLVTRSKKGDDVAQVLGGMLALINGLSEGYNAANTNPAQSLNATQMFWLSFQAEVGDIITAYSTSEEIEMWRQFPQMDPRRTSRHCSALVKVLPDDVFFSHDTWSSFNSMMRQYKTYSFEGRVVSMSGYPGVVHSIDDWYMTSNRLAVQETTNEVFNTSLFVEFVQPGTDTISEFLRVMIANFLATDSPSWVNYFKTENSGTYNNQWMVFDMKKFTPGTPLPADTFWVAEQLPGSEYPYGVTSKDMTEHLNTWSYWASYNLPYFTNVYDVSGNLQAYLQSGDFFSYTNYSRALIFHRNQSDVVDLDSMKAIMRYNNYKHDPFSLISNCTTATNGVCDPPYSAMLTIASRGDLNPPGGESHYGPNFGFLTLRDHCATDTKIAVWSKMMDVNGSMMTGVVINGPTRYQQPTFQWSTSPFANDATIIRHGLPDVYDFDFQEFANSYPEPQPTPSSGSSGLSKDAKLGIGIGIGVGGGILVIGALAYLLKAKSSTSDSQEQVNLV